MSPFIPFADEGRRTLAQLFSYGDDALVAVLVGADVVADVERDERDGSLRAARLQSSRVRLLEQESPKLRNDGVMAEADDGKRIGRRETAQARVRFRIRAGHDGYADGKAAVGRGSRPGAPILAKGRHRLAAEQPTTLLDAPLVGEEAKQEPASCKTQEEVQEVFTEECGRPLDDEMLNAIADDYISYHSTLDEPYKPSAIC